MSMVRRKNSIRKPELVIKSVSFKGKKQRGVYSNSSISKGSIIEICPVLVIKEKEITKSIEGYTYKHPDANKAVLALGMGSLYNHSFNPNAKARPTKNKVVITASKDISPGDQICISYGYSEEEFKAFGIR